ncbi:MAG: pectate lyase [Gemmataceae bacterium]
MNPSQCIPSILLGCCLPMWLPASTFFNLAQLPNEELRVAENVLLYQRHTGGWPKNYDRKQRLSKQQRIQLMKAKTTKDSTIDNGATYTEIRILAKVYQKKDDGRFQKAAMRGIRYLLEAQHANGGWPQRFPNPTGYARYITFNDNAMIGVLELLQDIAKAKEQFSFVPQGVRKKCELAVERGINCILKCQIRVDGRLTVWCAQHDHVTLIPRKARSYELPSLSGYESVGIVRFLMKIKEPSPRIIKSIDAAVSWLQRAELKGIKIVRRKDNTLPKGYDRVVVKSPNAPPMWARFYDIKTNRPIFCSRDGIPRANLADISYERRNGYSWLGYYARRLLSRDWPAWKRRVSRD